MNRSKLDKKLEVSLSLFQDNYYNCEKKGHNIDKYYKKGKKVI